MPAEEVIEQVLGLCFLWDQIEERPGEMILGGLSRKSRTIVLNEKHLELFEQKPGLLRSTQVHEAGHADLEGGLGEQGPSLFGEDQERIVHRHSTKSNQQLEVLLDLALRNEKAYRLWRKLTEGQDTPDQKSAVDRYQSAFLMPKWLLEEAAQRYDLTRWRDLYALAERDPRQHQQSHDPPAAPGDDLHSEGGEDDLPQQGRVHGTEDAVLIRPGVERRCLQSDPPTMRRRFQTQTSSCTSSRWWQPELAGRLPGEAGEAGNLPPGH